jgi:hypothetical protein
MSHPVFAWIVIGAGVLLVVMSLVADLWGLGRSPGFGWRQTLGVVAGALIVLLGVSLRRGKLSP